ncbi:preprotein translocase subunit SecG [Candidatus Uhrbacteria bacterium]|nr:preprotein translocase subunit SecG [Candidatus Uhrbacteria bacterium]
MVLNIVEIVLAVLLIAGILLQARGSGLGAAFGGDGNVYRTRRGIEKRLHVATIVVAVGFFAVALANSLF